VLVVQEAQPWTEQVDIAQRAYTLPRDRRDASLLNRRPNTAVAAQAERHAAGRVGPYATWHVCAAGWTGGYPDRFDDAGSLGAGYQTHDIGEKCDAYHLVHSHGLRRST
jgi:hypothetical protein